MKKPDSRNVVREWLTTKGARASVAIATRSALRALPLVGSPQRFGETSDPSKLENVVLAAFRMNLMAWSVNHVRYRPNLRSFLNQTRNQLLATTNVAQIGTGEYALGFKFEEYDKYLETPHWQSFRRIVFAEQRRRLGQNRCERCPKNGSEFKLDVHQLTYERLGNEKVDDVQIICKECHDKIHLRDTKSRARHRAPGFER